MRQSVSHLKPVNPEGRERGRREEERGRRRRREGGRREEKERGRETGIKNGFMHSTNINNHLKNNK